MCSKAGGSLSNQKSRGRRLIRPKYTRAGVSAGKREERKMEYKIAHNIEFGTLEISFEDRPSVAVRNALKGLKFRWHSIKKLWYGHADESTARAAIDAAESAKPAESKPEQTDLKNEYDVKAGDFFVCSWGYEQTNVNFFQVVALVGKSSVRVREVCPPIIEESASGSMAADRTYKITSEILPPYQRSIFTKDKERGDLCRIKPGNYSDPNEARKNCYILIAGRHHAYKCNGPTSKQYVSWYA